MPGAHQRFLMEVFGGYSFDRMTMSNPSFSSNMNGGMGSVGYNFRPWLQLVGDSSYNFVTTSGTKYVLWGNHFGARYFYRRHNRWALTPFVEGLVGGSRLDLTVSGTGGYKTSQNCISYRAGGGVDFHLGGRWAVRLINVDYYRTSFSANGVSATQNNYWASAGIVLRLFGSPATD